MKAIAGNEKEEGFGMLGGGPYITSQAYKSGSTLKQEILLQRATVRLQFRSRKSGVYVLLVLRRLPRILCLSCIQTGPVASLFMHPTLSHFQALYFLVANLHATRYKNNHGRYTSFIPKDKYLYTILGNEKMF